MAKIKDIQAREILNAKGLPTVEAIVILDDGKVGAASCPTGETISSYESVEIKDNDLSRFSGKGSLKAVDIIRKTIAPGLIGREAERQQEIDKIMIDMDGTQNKSKLGTNSMLAVSMATAKASAASSVLPLFVYLSQYVKKDHASFKIPIPILNQIRGKREEGLADFHEFLLIPASFKSYTDSIQMGEALHNSLKKILQAKNTKILSDYEEGFAANLSSNKEAFAYIRQAAEDAHVRLGFDAFFGIDCKASEFYKEGKYRIKDKPLALTSKDMIAYYEEINNETHLLYLEDPLAADDWDGWKMLFDILSKTAIIAGGDLVSTNPYRLQTALDKKTINAIVIKPSQIGTVIESLAIAEAAKATGLKVIVSHRNEETNDDFISDFSVAVNADYVKMGSLTRGENIAKYNRLLQIENNLKVL